MGIRFAKKPPANSVEMNILANMIFRIPPAAPNHKGQMTFTFPADALVLSFMPHMHLRGISARYVLTYPDGTTETLLSVPDYDFGWQSVYRFEKPLRRPQGKQADLDRPLGQLGGQPPQPRPDQGRLLGLADLGRDAERLDGSGVEEAEDERPRRKLGTRRLSLSQRAGLAPRFGDRRPSDSSGIGSPVGSHMALGQLSPLTSG